MFSCNVLFIFMISNLFEFISSGLTLVLYKLFNYIISSYVIVYEKLLIKYFIYNHYSSEL